MHMTIETTPEFTLAAKYEYLLELRECFCNSRGCFLRCPTHSDTLQITKTHKQHTWIL